MERLMGAFFHIADRELSDIVLSTLRDDDKIMTRDHIERNEL